jgi:hypothetical protein
VEVEPTQPNSEVEADVALAALGTTQLNSSRYADSLAQHRSHRRQHRSSLPRTCERPRVRLQVCRFGLTALSAQLRRPSATRAVVE